MLKKTVLGVLTAACLVAVGATKADAATFFTIDDGSGDTVTCTTGSNSCSSSGTVSGATIFFTADNILFSGTVGTFTFTGLQVTSDSPGTTTFAHVTDTKTDVTTTADGSVTITFGSTDYNLPTGPDLTLSASQTENVTTSTGLTTSSFTGCGNASNTTAFTGTCTTAGFLSEDAGVTQATASSSPHILFVRGVNPYSLIGQEVLTLTAGTIASFTGTIAVSPVPEPASMLLFGTGLLGAASRYRRRRSLKQQA